MLAYSCFSCISYIQKKKKNQHSIWNLHSKYFQNSVTFHHFQNYQHGTAAILSCLEWYHNLLKAMRNGSVLVRKSCPKTQRSIRASGILTPFLLNLSNDFQSPLVWHGRPLFLRPESLSLTRICPLNAPKSQPTCFCHKAFTLASCFSSTLLLTAPYSRPHA